MRSLSDITQEERDALRIIENFTSAMAWGSMFSEKTCTLAADWLGNPNFSWDTKDKPLIDAFVTYLREQAKE